MKTQKLLVIVALVCLMAFLNVSTFAQTAQAADPASVMPRFVAQTLRAAGLQVKRHGDVLIVEEQITLRVPSTLQDWEEGGIRLVVDGGIRDRLVRPLGPDTDEPGDELLRFVEFRQCLNTADFINKVRYTQCEFTLNPVGALLCKTRVLLNHVFDNLNCIFTYLCSPENNFCE